jgi:hypothetical protein
MQRWRAERHIAIKRRREHLSLVHGWPARPVECVCDRQVGRFRKRKALGCGRTRCFICHADKLLGRIRPREINAELNTNEGLDEVLGKHR